MTKLPTYEQMAKDIAEIALDEIFYDGKTIRELMKIVVEADYICKWIPVSERLPNFNDIVLASTDNEYDELRIILTVYNAEEYWFNGKIKAWMPLPEPYEPQESEDKE